ncbi:hypothetical protein L9F63_012467, partial [Diploptera punctata]
MKRTQSNSSLSDHSSPPQGSPKPATRRKNKPAPVPPANNTSPKESASIHDKPEKPPRPSVGPISSTLPRPSKKHNLDQEVRTAITTTTENTTIVTMEKQQKSCDNYIPTTARKQSADGLEQHQLPSSMHRRANSGGGEKISLETTKSSESSEIPVTEQVRTAVPTATTVTITSGNVAKVSSISENQQKSTGPPPSSSFSTLERKHPPRPVAAPRNAANICTSNVIVNKDVQNQSSENKSSENVAVRMSNESTKEEDNGGQDGVVYRRPLLSDSGERLNKPAVPERPATLLRPHSSFRGSRHSADSDSSIGDKSNAESERPMLERTHMYSVDKQQVSIIQVGGEKEKTVAVPTNNNNNEGSRSLSGKLHLIVKDKGQSQEKPERPPRPENSNSDSERGQHQSSHSRTMSEGTFSTSTQISQETLQGRT